MVDGVVIKPIFAPSAKIQLKTYQLGALHSIGGGYGTPALHSLLIDFPYHDEEQAPAQP